MNKPDSAASFAYDLLVTAHPGLLSVDELIREFAGGEPDPLARLSVEEALKILDTQGLVHRLGRFAFATRSAVHAHRLEARA
jgi:hypothetical protein